MITRNEIFDFIDNHILSPIEMYLEDKSFEYPMDDPKSDYYWDLSCRIGSKFRRFKFKHGYKHTPKPMPEWLRNSLMAYCDLSEEDVKKCGEYFRK